MICDCQPICVRLAIYSLNWKIIAVVDWIEQLLDPEVNAVT